MQHNIYTCQNYINIANTEVSESQNKRLETSLFACGLVDEQTKKGTVD